jgi:hypothetical protein
MKYELMFLCLIIPDLEHPRKNLHVMMQPLIKELKKLLEGIKAYDSSKEKFTLHVTCLWSMYDFMAYNIFSAWSYLGTLICLIYDEDIDCFFLEFSGKICYFDYHKCFLPNNHAFNRKRNTFRKKTIATKGGTLKSLSKPEIDVMLSKLV